MVPCKEETLIWLNSLAAVELQWSYSLFRKLYIRPSLSPLNTECVTTRNNCSPISDRNRGDCSKGVPPRSQFPLFLGRNLSGHKLYLKANIRPESGCRSAPQFIINSIWMGEGVFLCLIRTIRPEVVNALAPNAPGSDGPRFWPQQWPLFAAFRGWYTVIGRYRQWVSFCWWRDQTFL